MKRLILFLTIIMLSNLSFGQKVESIHFNLYTDSLKKGFYNYINVDGKYTDGNWLPLDSTSIKFTANTGHFIGNDLFIDSSYTADSVKVKAVLRSNPSIAKEVVIYIRKRPFSEPLKTNDEILNELEAADKRTKKKKK